MSTSPRKLGNYVILKRLGAGGMGKVYLAQQQSTQRKVALKVLSADHTKDPEFFARFQREARALAKLSHLNIVKAIDFGQTDEYAYLSMEYVEGSDLQQLLLQRGKWNEKEALQIVRQVTEALRHASKEKIIHRDIKPDNILINSEGVVKVTDWGLAKELDSDMRLTQTGITYGTPDFMSPEQIRGEKLDGRSDIYSLGATWYYMVTGHPPFEAKNEPELMNKHLTASPSPPRKWVPELSKECSALILKMLSKPRAARPRSASILLREIDRLLEEDHSANKPGTRAKGRRPATKTSARQRQQLVIWLAIGVMILGLLFFLRSKNTSQGESLPKTPTESSLPPRGP